MITAAYILKRLLCAVTGHTYLLKANRKERVCSVCGKHQVRVSYDWNKWVTKK